MPPSPADSGVSDVDSSSSGNGQPICSDEIKARLGLSQTAAGNAQSGQQQQQLPPPPPGTFLHPNFYSQAAPLRNLWNNRSCKSPSIISFCNPSQCMQQINFIMAAKLLLKRLNQQFCYQKFLSHAGKNLFA